MADSPTSDPAETEAADGEVQPTPRKAKAKNQAAAKDKAEADPAATPAEAPPSATARAPRRRWLSWGLQALVVVLLYLGATHWRTRSLLPTDGTQQAPALRLAQLDGSRFDLAELRGKRVQLHFWATWCGVCLQELGALNRVHEGLAPDEALVSVVADSEDPEAIRRFVKENDIRYPVLLGNAAALRAYRIEAFPTNYYLDSAGRVRGTDVGMSTRWGMSRRIGCAR